MKKRTLNAQRPTPNIEWFRVSEDDGVYRSKAATLNAQRSTSNAQLASKPRFDLEDRLLDFSARIIRLSTHCQIQELQTISRVSCFGAALRRTEIMAKLKLPNRAKISFIS